MIVTSYNSAFSPYFLSVLEYFLTMSGLPINKFELYKFIV